MNQVVQLACARGPEGTLRVALGGEWKLARGVPHPGSSSKRSTPPGAPRQHLPFRRHPGESPHGADGNGRLKRKAYEKELSKLHVELVKLQEWVKHEGFKVCIVFEGRDGAGKGGTIKAITERVSPRVFRVIASPPHRAREDAVLRAALHDPSARRRRGRDLRSQLVQPGGRRARDWVRQRGGSGALPRCHSARRARLGPVEDPAPQVLDGGEREGADRRLQARIDDGRKIWKLSPMDLESYGRWYDYSARGTRCSPPPICPSRPGTWSVQTTSGARA